MRISKRILPFLLCALLGSCCKPDGNDPNSRPDASDNGKSLPDPVTISVIGTSDVHGHIEWAPILGGYVDILRAKRKSDGGVLLIDAGDMFQGTIAANETEGAAMIRAYNALGYDAASIGNHEFDYGPVGPNNIPRDPGDNPFGALQAAAKQAKFPLLAANLLDAATNKPVNWDGVAPSVIVDVRGISVGIVGVAGKNSLQSTIAPNVTTVKMEPPVDAILREAKQLREKGAAIVVVSAHEGGDCKKFDDPNDTSSCKVKDEIFNIANALDPGIVQVIVAAHTHQSMAHKVNGIAIIQSGADGNAFGRVDIKVDRTTKTVVD
ncbi:MAG: metallophosphoesterase, partial [Polyangiaceae bacterium]|nr:metallophosphoesterase [Polyangiaceae bacterium]